MTDVVDVNDFEKSEIFGELVNKLNIEKSYLMNVVDGIYNKAKELRENKHPEPSKDLNELLREKNLTPKDVTNISVNNIKMK